MTDRSVRLDALRRLRQAEPSEEILLHIPPGRYPAEEPQGWTPKEIAQVIGYTAYFLFVLIPMCIGFAILGAALIEMSR